jgi:hypothetical protein
VDIVEMDVNTDAKRWRARGLGGTKWRKAKAERKEPKKKRRRRRRRRRMRRRRSMGVQESC